MIIIINVTVIIAIVIIIMIIITMFIIMNVMVVRATHSIYVCVKRRECVWVWTSQGGPWRFTMKEGWKQHIHTYTHTHTHPPTHTHTHIHTYTCTHNTLRRQVHSFAKPRGSSGQVCYICTWPCVPPWDTLTPHTWPPAHRCGAKQRGITSTRTPAATPVLSCNASVSSAAATATARFSSERMWCREGVEGGGGRSWAGMRCVGGEGGGGHG